jgi:hypothetical protein
MLPRQRTNGIRFLRSGNIIDGPLHYIIAGNAGVRAMAWAESVYWWHSTAARVGHGEWRMEAVDGDRQMGK